MVAKCQKQKSLTSIQTHSQHLTYTEKRVDDDDDNDDNEDDVKKTSKQNSPQSTVSHKTNETIIIFGWQHYHDGRITTALRG